MVVNAVPHSVPSHFPDGSMATRVPLFPESSQIVQVNAAMAPYSVERNFTGIEQPDQELS
jgi:hypothetical protein